MIVQKSFLKLSPSIELPLTSRVSPPTSLVRLHNMGSTESHSINQSVRRRSAHQQPHSSPANLPSHLTPSLSPPAFFVLPRDPSDLQHHHLPPKSADIAKVTAILTSLRLPVELVQRILEEAEYFVGCRRLQKKQILVSSDSQLREAPSRWVNGQEKALTEEIKMEGSGLKSGKGELWYLVSSPIGCDARPAVADLSAKDWQWTEVAEREEAASQHLEGRGSQRMVWVRRIILETLSRDQGWSSGNPAHYGKCKD